MKVISLFVFLIAITLSAAELPIADSSTFANIQQGNLVVGGGLMFSQSSRGKTTTSNLDLGLSTLYFVIDHLALGLVGDLIKETDGDTVALIGPAAQYTFWQKDSLTTYLQLSYQKGLTDVTVSGRVDTKLGVQYFITPSVAAGPYLSYTHVFGRRSPDYDRYTFGAALGIYL